MAEAEAVDSPVAGVPTMNSCPTRCACVTRARAACARLAGVVTLAVTRPGVGAAPAGPATVATVEAPVIASAAKRETTLVDVRRLISL
jgi:hypothetical protein